MFDLEDWAMIFIITGPTLLFLPWIGCGSGSVSSGPDFMKATSRFNGGCYWAAAISEMNSEAILITWGGMIRM